MLEYQTNLDSKVKYASEPLVDEELEAEVEGGHYSKRNVDRCAKRQKAKTSKLQQKLKWQNRQVTSVTEKLTQTQAALEEANRACHDLRLEVKKLVKEAKENQIADECKQQDIEEYIQELEAKVRKHELHSHTEHKPFFSLKQEQQADISSTALSFVSCTMLYWLKE